MFIQYDKVHDLVVRLSFDFHIPKQAAYSIAWCITNCWNHHGHVRWFDVSEQRQALSKQQIPSILLMHKCLNYIEAHPTEFFSDQEGPTQQDMIYKPTMLEKAIVEHLAKKKLGEVRSFVQVQIDKALGGKEYDLGEDTNRSTNPFESVQTEIIPAPDPGCDREQGIQEGISDNAAPSWEGFDGL